jgi:hypothetical protein
LKFTASIEYRILRCILNHNVKFHFPKLSEILTELDFTSRNTIEVTINSLKQRGLIKTIGNRTSYSYFLSEQGVDRVRNFEDYDDRLILIQIAKLKMGDEHCLLQKN